MVLAAEPLQALQTMPMLGLQASAIKQAIAKYSIGIGIGIGIGGSVQHVLSTPTPRAPRQLTARMAARSAAPVALRRHRA